MGNAFNLEHDQVKKLDEAYAEFVKQFTGFYQNNSTSEFGPDIRQGKSIEEQLKQFEKRCDELGKEQLSSFDTLYLEHVAESIASQHRYFDFFFPAADPQNVDSYLAQEFGLDAFFFFDIVEKSIKKNSDLDPMQRDLSTTMVPSQIDTFRSLIQQILPLIKEELVSYCISHDLIPREFASGLPEKYAFDITLSQANQGGGDYDSDSGLITIGDQEFRIYNYRRQTAIFPGLAFLTGFHEFAGHTGQVIYSTNMPRMLRGFSAHMKNIAAMPTTEGFALFRERYDGIQMMHDRKKDLGFRFKNGSTNLEERIGISTKELDYVIQLSDFVTRACCIDDVYKYLLLKHGSEQEAREAYQSWRKEHREQLGFARSERITPYPDKINEKNLFDFPYDMSYYKGYYYSKEVWDQALKKVDDVFVQQNSVTIKEIFATGTWAWKVWPKFITYALEHIEEYKQEYRTNLLIPVESKSDEALSSVPS